MELRPGYYPCERFCKVGMRDENNPVFSGYDRYFQIEKQYPTPISKTVVQSTVNEAEDIAQA